jgi:plasmid stabilization system protein ParE
MARKVIWAPEALKDLADVLQYLLETYAESVSEKFTQAVEEQIEIISIYPELGLSSARQPKIRKALITEHNAMFYSLEADVILIRKIIDTRTQRYYTDR